MVKSLLSIQHICKVPRREERGIEHPWPLKPCDEVRFSSSGASGGRRTPEVSAGVSEQGEVSLCGSLGWVEDKSGS